ncbi:GNAT family N-acetyltransferase [Candidatus Bathyarchaeota archaeon]|nr:GNAT family N-acetyltransferase [Candidatus Bathyarchaeota archaeon]
MCIIREAVIDDLARVEEIVEKSYSKYVERIGKPPAPMKDDYRKLIEEKRVYVLDVEGVVQGVLVLIPQKTHMLLDNVAVHPSIQSRGYGGKLMQFAEDHATVMGYSEIRLYTHEKMTETQEMYRHLGWSEYKRQNDDGYRRIYMKKNLKK